MKKVSISEARYRLSELLERVRRGESFLITDQDRPVARLEPVRSDRSGEAKGRLARLERAGLLRAGSGAPVKRIPSEPAPRARAGAEERGSGR